MEDCASIENASLVEGPDADYQQRESTSTGATRRRLLGSVAVTIAISVAVVATVSYHSGTSEATNAEFSGAVELDEAETPQHGIWYRAVENAEVREGESMESKILPWSPLEYGQRALVVETDGRRAKLIPHTSNGRKLMPEFGWASMYTKEGVQILTLVPDQQNPGRGDTVFTSIRKSRQELGKNMKILFDKMGVKQTPGSGPITKGQVDQGMQSAQQRVSGLIGTAKQKAQQMGINNQRIQKMEGGANKIESAFVPGGMTNETMPTKAQGSSFCIGSHCIR